MASARQRSRKHARRVHHVRAQRARLRAALDSAPSTFTLGELRRHMGEHGFEPVGLGRWRAQRPVVMTGQRRGPSWLGIVTKRKLKKRRK